MKIYLRFCVIFFMIVNVTFAKDDQIPQNRLNIRNNNNYKLVRNKEFPNYVILPNEGQITAIINDYADKVLVNVGNFMLNNHIDPTPLADIAKKILVFGEFNMTSGTLEGLHTIHRQGDVVVSYDEEKQLRITLPLTFDELNFNYKYAVKYLDLGPTGLVTGGVTDFEMLIVIKVDLANYVFSLEDYEITKSGHISVHFDGNPITDWLLDILTNTATVLLKPIILAVIDNIVQGTLESVFDRINEIIDNFLHPTTSTPVTTEALTFFFNRL